MLRVSLSKRPVDSIPDPAGAASEAGLGTVNETREDPMTATTAVLDLVERWAAAEQGNDAEALDGLLADDFVGVGPVGFVLGREQWLGRFGNGLENRA